MAGALTAAIAAAFAGGVTPDPYFEYTTLLLPGNGTNGAQNNTFLDGSTNNFTITRNGNTTQGTFSPFSQTGWGNYFNGTSGYLTASDSGFVATGDFTVEAWVYGTLTGAYQGIFSSADATDTAGFRLGIINTNFLEFWLNGSVNSSTAYVFNQWNHIAMVRSGSSSNNVSCYFNGTRVAQFTNTSSTTNSLVALGRYRTGGTNQYWFGGYLSNARLVTGAALYSGATITVPTSPLSIAPSGTTQLLTCQSNRFVDNSSTPKTITINGTVTVQAFSPFNPTASWSAATYGGSGYFDGSGDYLTVADNTALDMESSDFTMEAWIYPTATFASLGNGTLFSKRSSNAVFGGVLVLFGGSNAPIFRATSTNSSWDLINSTSTVSVIPSQWNHVAIARSSGNWALWVNGSRGVSATGVTGTVSNNTAAFGLGANADGSEAWPTPVYVGGSRIVKGTAVYDPTQTSITVPTAPLTAITNTSLLLNFTNAGIYDATSKNDLETVGNAQISNTTAQFGGTSIKFNGTTDYLVFPSTGDPRFDFGTGDFTVECWIYLNSIPSNNYRQILSFGTTSSSQRWLLLFDTRTVTSSPYLAFYSLNSSNAVTTEVKGGGASGWSSGVWYYVAVTRSGNDFKLFRDGSQNGATVTDADPVPGTSSTGRMYIGAEVGGSLAFWDGYIQDVRITRGYARPITAKPTAAFPTL